jgi:peptidyl-prolyl cis-trans isomerase B (cyclophilin B)
VPTERQRREAERRRRQRQLQRRRQRETARRRWTLIVSGLGAVMVVALVVFFVVQTSDDDKAPKKHPAAAATSSSVSPSATAAAAAYPCTWTKSGTAARKVSVPPTAKPSRSGTVDVSIRTTQGAMTFALDRAAAPCAVESFISLAQQKYFDKSPCHRLTTSGIFVLQCGDPTGTGKGGPGYSFKDELTGKEKYTRGVLAMANSGPNTNGSQFFIVYATSTLGPQYTVFGKVSAGLGVVDKVAALGSTPAQDGKPKLAISISTATVEK